MVKSAEALTGEEDRVTFFVFTDNPLEAKKFAAEISRVQVRIFEIDSYGWPEATLLRYQIFESRIKEMDADILMHLDADMLITSNPWPRIRKALLQSRICLVKHPGFWRPKGIERLFLYVKNPVMVYRDVRLRFEKGGLGSWESNAHSQAFVARKSRFNYYCGGTWFGKSESIREMLKILSKQVSEDLQRNIIANWHDESHLNKWAIENLHGDENPELCFDGTYPQLRQLRPVIVAVRKPQTVR